MQVIDVWINCPSLEVARTLARRAVEERLAACANILAPIESRYHWQGRIEHEEEIPLLLKTRGELFELLAERLSELHPYEVPSILGLEATFVNTAYAAWIARETAAAGGQTAPDLGT
jgi:periplasmic divalent cation tolerance protein